MSVKEELSKHFRESQQKYVYYLVALAVTAIGFSVYQTSGRILHITLLPLGIAVLFWGISTFCGLRFLKYGISITSSNVTYFDIEDGNHPKVGNNPELKDVAKKSIKKALELNVETAGKYFKWQEITFYLGVVFFISWHIIEMTFAKCNAVS